MAINENNNDYILHPQIKNSTAVAILSALMIFVVLGTIALFYMLLPPKTACMPKSATKSQHWYDEKEFKRLHRYHGYPAVVIYEEGKAPYFYDKRGRKALFVYPAERIRQPITSAQ
ncbi:MAG TPA: hypothetical protein PLW90_07180 [Smithellaceae bacterium]|jgi:hypothetical protein|nr:MAG: hypothetical protein BWY90_00782 [Deltaproteobacteria bacterium ADurb.BinA014]HNQ18371.1 hypothetical protein [Smithellaceae bacterium]HNT90963.1 hypothetical protein [Smithellaceae bacterium]HNV64615.1 hypothetical protein [Smithellaceae bacterium]HNZ32130.1 hypothetical protein [Smithellaceae bacterium]